MRRLRIILIAHDGKKTDLVEWARFNAGTLRPHELITTAATGDAIQDIPGLTVRTLLHGPLGGDA
jgi:methylglyoxal synthase